MSNIRLIRPGSENVITPEEEAPTRGAEFVPAVMPSAVEILDCLAQQKGEPGRAAAALGINESDVYRAVLGNVAALSTRLRAVLMLESFKTLCKVQSTMLSEIHEMTPDSLGRTYAASLSAFSQLASQFEDSEQIDEEDDADAAKQDIMERLTKMGKRVPVGDTEAQTG